MKNETIITVSNVLGNEYFFTTDHCQDHGLGEEWVPVSYHNTNKICVKNTFYYNKKEIPNPDKTLQA